MEKEGTKKRMNITQLLKQNGYNGVVDHEGTEFKSLAALCKHWHLTTGEFIQETLNGRDMQDILESSIRNNIVKDHLGNVFNSEEELCKYWGIKRAIFKDRVDRLEWDIDKALTFPTGKNESYETSVRRITNQLHSELVKDHLGNEFNSVGEMCKYWKVTGKDVKHRLETGFSLKQALELQNKPVVDHLGKKYRNVREMCEAYNIPYSTYQYRKRENWTLSRILNTPVGAEKKVKDHLENEFPTLKEMCEYYKITTAAYKSRMKSGWTLKDALTLELGTRRLKPCYTKINDDGVKIYIDHKGNEYKTLLNMCNTYGISVQNFKNRIKKGKSLDEALLIPLTQEELEVTKFETIKDHLGNEFSNLKSMADYWGVKASKLNYGLKVGKDLKDILESGTRDKEETDEQD